MEEASKYLSYILRHNPKAINVQMNEYGYVNIDELLDKFPPKYKLNKDIFLILVNEDNKKRYKLDGNYVRASQRHSIAVNLQLNPIAPPPHSLYHGTNNRFKQSIIDDGLLPMSRQIVHLSDDMETAKTVDSRHGSSLLIYKVDTERMLEQNYKFFKSENGVWLTKTVPTEFLTDTI